MTTMMNPNPRTSTDASTDPPVGYKRTEVGVIPEDWGIKSLSDLSPRQNLVRGPFGGALKKESFVESGFKVYEQRNAIYKTCEIGSYFISPSKFSEMQRFSVVPGDFIVSCSGTIGRIFQIPPEAPPGVINQALLKIRTDDRIVFDRFFKLLFEWDRFQARIIDSTQGGAMQNLVGMEVFRKTPFAVPPLPEQRGIVGALSDVDGLLAALEALIAKKRAIKQGAMQQLLTGRTRLPGFTGEWTATTMARIGSTYGGLTGKTKADFGIGDARYVTFLNVLENVIVDHEQFEHVRIRRDESQNPVQEGDLLFNGTSETPGDLAMGAVLLHQVAGLFLNSFCFGFRISDQQKYDALFLAYFYRGPVGRSILYGLAQGATRYNLSRSQFLALELSLPRHDEQVAIATVLSDMDAEIDALSARLAKTRDIKRGVMQELLTGRTRLVEPKEVAA